MSRQHRPFLDTLAERPRERGAEDKPCHRDHAHELDVSRRELPEEGHDMQAADRDAYGVVRPVVLRRAFGPRLWRWLAVCQM